MLLAIRMKADFLEYNDLLEKLSTISAIQIATKGRALICLTGRSGSGKSTLGKAIRKNGLPNIPASRIAVIDDGVLAVPLLGLFTQRVKHSFDKIDELAPFERYLHRKKVIVYVSSRPERRISACDIVVRVSCDEEERRLRLLARNKDGERRFQQSSVESDIISIPAEHYFEFNSQKTYSRG